MKSFKATQLHRFGIALCLFAAMFTLGCDEEPVAEKPSRVSLLTSQYVRFVYGSRGKMPQDEAEFKKFLAKREEQLLAAAELENFDELFVSERDGQPLVILYGKKTKKMGDEIVIVHEATGENGLIMVGTKSGLCELREPKEIK